MRHSPRSRRRSRRAQRAPAAPAGGRWLLIAGAGVVAAFVIVVGVLAASGFFGGDSPAADDLSIARARDLEAGGHSLGADGAPVTVLEFADFQCPYCRVLWAGPLQQLKREFVDTGKVRLVYRHRMVVGPESVLAAEASECAADQGGFFRYHDVLFGAQGPENAGYLTAARLARFAGEAGLDQSALGECLAAGTHRDEVTRLSNEARDAGINSTPTVFVNGRRIVNPFDLDSLRATILAAGGGG